MNEEVEDGFMVMSNAARHDWTCPWARPGVIDSVANPCTCGLTDDITSLLRAPAISIIDQHIPSLTDEDEAVIEDHARDWLFPDPGYNSDAADLAIRTCKCGEKIDGFYEYVDHLKEVLKQTP